MPNGDNPYLTQDDPYNFQWGGFDFDLPFFQYQGISPDIMSALSNIFTPASGQSLQLDALLGGGLGDWGQFLDPSISFGDDSTTLDWTFDLGPLEQDYSQELEGLEGALPFTNIFDPESLAATLSAMGAMDDPIRAGQVKALTPEMLEKTTSAYYDPYEIGQRGELVDKLSKAMGKAGTGGFAGSGQREAGLSGAEKLYRGGYEDLLAEIMKMRGGATENVLDTIYGWQELMSGQ